MEKLTELEIKELSKDPTQGFDNCSKCGGVQLGNTMECIEEDLFDLICDDCLLLICNENHC